ncbi:hypothetical protein [Zavarzinella formosa]|uniref:hypothetical protein n=1 Tax=Zavarzinella formosa TaxID=360055 RepID=UPI0002DAB1CB|nr:hypothetical protein [Zavarzinella formosa]
MESFPFTDDEWNSVVEATRVMLNATFAGDDNLRASLLPNALEALNNLRERHGDHPILAETAADFIDDPVEREELYRHAARLSLANELPTYSIRISLAQLLLDTGRRAEARETLLACEGELTIADDWDRTWWSELYKDSSETPGDPASPQ